MTYLRKLTVVALIAGTCLSTSAMADSIKYKIAPYDYEYLTVHPLEAKKTKDNKKTLGKILAAIGAQDWDKMRTLYASGLDYTQHSAYIEDHFDGVLKLFKNIDYKELVYDQTMSIAEGPYVVVMSKLQFSKKDPMLIAIDINFIRDGRSHAHWDILSPAQENKSGRTAFDSVHNDEITVSEHQVKKNKEIVAEMINLLFNKKQKGNINKFFAEKYYEHGEGEDGRDGVAYRIDKYSDSYWDIKRIVAENDIVFSHSRVTNKGKIYAVAEFYRLRDDKIVEHWESVQEIDKNPKNPNSEF